MHAKYPTTARIFLSVLLCSELVISGETPGKPNENVKETLEKSVGEYSSEYISTHPIDVFFENRAVPTTNYETSETKVLGKPNEKVNESTRGSVSEFSSDNSINAVPTTNYKTSEKPTTLTNVGSVIENSSLINPNGGTDEHYKLDNLQYTDIVGSNSFKNVEEFSDEAEGIVNGTKNDDYKIRINDITETVPDVATPHTGSTGNPATDLNSYASTSYQGINSTPSVVVTPKMQKIVSEKSTTSANTTFTSIPSPTSYMDTVNITNDVSSKLDSSMPNEPENKGKSHAFQKSIPTEIEYIKKNDLLAKNSEQMLNKEDDSKLKGNSTSDTDLFGKEKPSEISIESATTIDIFANSSDLGKHAREMNEDIVDLSRDYNSYTSTSSHEDVLEDDEVETTYIDDLTISTIPEYSYMEDLNREETESQKSVIKQEVTIPNGSDAGLFGKVELKDIKTGSSKTNDNHVTNSNFEQNSIHHLKNNNEHELSSTEENFSLIDHDQSSTSSYEGQRDETEEPEPAMKQDKKVPNESDIPDDSTTTNDNYLTSTDSEQNVSGQPKKNNEKDVSSTLVDHVQSSTLLYEGHSEDDGVPTTYTEPNYFPVSTIPNDNYREDSETEKTVDSNFVMKQDETTPTEMNNLFHSTGSDFTNKTLKIEAVTFAKSASTTFTSVHSHTSHLDTVSAKNVRSEINSSFNEQEKAKTSNLSKSQVEYTQWTDEPTKGYIDEDTATEYETESISPTMAVQYSEMLENQTNIITTERIMSLAYSNGITSNLDDVNTETTTEDVTISSTPIVMRKISEKMELPSHTSPAMGDNSSDDKETNYSNTSAISEIITPSTEFLTEGNPLFIFPDDTTTTLKDFTSSGSSDWKEISKITENPSYMPAESVTHEVLTTERGHSPSFPCYGAQIYNYTITEIGKTYIRVTWTLSNYTDFCQLEINLSCNSADYGFDWVVTHKNYSTNVIYPETVSYLEDLSEFTNYSCIGQLLLTEEEKIFTTKTFDVTTKPEVPSDITFNVTDVTPESFFLSWLRPAKIPGNLQKYHIIIKMKKTHYIRDNCTSRLIESSISFSSEEDNPTYNFTDAKPNNLYEVQILAQDEAGNSTGIAEEILTESSRSTVPLNATSTLYKNTYHCNGDTYNITLQLNWELPCNTHGELLWFEVKITEIIHSDRNFTGSKTSYKVQKNPDIKNFTYGLIVRNLNASCFYEIVIAAVSGSYNYGFPTVHTSQLTNEGCPSEPENILVFPLSHSSFFLKWKEPEKYFGKIIGYNVLITESGPRHKLLDDPTCERHSKVRLNETTNSTFYKFESGLPNSVYRFMIEARTSAGIGKPSKENEVITKTKESEPIRNLEIKEISLNITDEMYEYKVRITFKKPCNTNGQFISYLMREEGTRLGYQNVFVKTELNKTSYDVILRNPEYVFDFDIRVISEDGQYQSIGVNKSITTVSAIPKSNEKKIQFSTNKDNPTEIKMVIEKGIFSSENGEISHYTIFLFEDVDENSISKKPSFGFCNKICPQLDTTFPFFKAKSSFQMTSSNWNPFTNETRLVTLSIGKKEDCSVNDFCRPLSENTNYIILLRGRTRGTYRDIFYLVKTGNKSSPNVALFILPLIILAVIVILGIYLYLKNDRSFTIRFRSIPNTSEEPILRHLVAVKHFKSYYNKTQNDPIILRKQYEEIEDEIKIYKDENVHTTFALKPENKRKNRYTNILPYDEYRVKLQMDEDDEISSDYINASYIRGASGEVEYIATQGPLEHTCKDFWKMVIQENVTVIVMVSQFIEKEKEKCFKYFPNNHENMMICENLEVKCLTELQFDTHSIRTLLIRKDLKQFSVIHMQYLDWPDFGCPSGTYNMLSFCQEVRDRIQIEKGLMAVHCSAGVGRTGTLISLDILLQTMQRKKEISIFECVMDLRKQRTHMVQTEKQYVYIYTCLNDVLENCSLYSFDDTKRDEEHIYVNVDDKKQVRKNSHYEEKESVF